MTALLPTPDEVFGPLAFGVGLVIGVALGFVMGWLKWRGATPPRDGGWM